MPSLQYIFNLCILTHEPRSSATQIQVWTWNRTMIILPLGRQSVQSRAPNQSEFNGGSKIPVSLTIVPYDHDPAFRCFKTTGKQRDIFPWLLSVGSQIEDKMGTLQID